MIKVVVHSYMELIILQTCPNIYYTLYQPRLSYIELAPTVFIISMSLNIILALNLSEKKSEIPAAWLFWSGLWEIIAV